MEVYMSVNQQLQQQNPGKDTAYTHTKINLESN